MIARNLSLTSIIGTPVLATALLFSASFPISAQAQSLAGAELLQQTLGQYCIACHNDSLRSGELSLQNLDLSQLGEHAAIPEKVLAQLRRECREPKIVLDLVVLILQSLDDRMNRITARS